MFSCDKKSQNMKKGNYRMLIRNLRKMEETKQLNIGSVTNRYLFFYEDEGEEGYHFIIEAKDYEEAFDKAYESYGPEVNGMMYKLIH